MKKHEAGEYLYVDESDEPFPHGEVRAADVQAKPYFESKRVGDGRLKSFLHASWRRDGEGVFPEVLLFVYHAESGCDSQCGV